MYGSMELRKMISMAYKDNAITRISLESYIPILKVLMLVSTGYK
jgi:hypothetical protein